MLLWSLSVVLLWVAYLLDKDVNNHHGLVLRDSEFRYQPDPFEERLRQLEIAGLRDYYIYNTKLDIDDIEWQVFEDYNNRKDRIKG